MSYRPSFKFYRGQEAWCVMEQMDKTFHAVPVVVQGVQIPGVGGRHYEVAWGLWVMEHNVFDNEADAQAEADRRNNSPAKTGEEA